MMAPGAPPRTRRRRSTEVPRTVTNQPGGREAPLAAGARLIARGGVLDDQLDGLAAGACAMTGATSAVVYLFDGDSGILVAAGSAGGLRARGIVPRVTEDATGSQEVQGLLVAGLPTMPDDPAATLADLDAIGGLAGAAVRRARLEQALVERSDWYDRVAHTDPLTGLANRRTFDRMLELELARAGRAGSPGSVALFDIDGLAAIRPGLGADVGGAIRGPATAATSSSSSPRAPAGRSRSGGPWPRRSPSARGAGHRCRCSARASSA